MTHVNQPTPPASDGAEERLEVSRQTQNRPDALAFDRRGLTKSAPSMLQEVRSISDQTPVRMRTAARKPDFASMRNEDFVSYKVSVLSRILDRGVDKKLLAGFNLPLTALRLLGHLHARGEGRVLAMARMMHMLGSQVSQSMMEVRRQRSGGA